MSYICGLQSLNQSSLGDNNGNPYDGNRAVNGEFGDYYCAPAAAAVAVKLWVDRGYYDLLADGSSYLSIPQLAEKLAGYFKTRDHYGTFDENVILGLRQFCVEEDILEVDFFRHPDYFDIRTWVEEEEKAVMIGISGNKSVLADSGWLCRVGTGRWILHRAGFQSP